MIRLAQDGTSGLHERFASRKIVRRKTVNKELEICSALPAYDEKECAENVWQGKRKEEGAEMRCVGWEEDNGQIDNRQTGGQADKHTGTGKM